MNKKLIYGCALVAATMMLAACGGDGGGGGSGGTKNSKFTQTATWTVALPGDGDSVCYDFDAKTEAACSSADWDLKLTGDGQAASFYTNSGTSSSAGGGNGGTLGVDTWASLKDTADATEVPAIAWLRDGLDNVFAGSNSINSALFEYGVDGSHFLFPSYRVFLITTDSTKTYEDGVQTPNTIFALQVTGYYGGDTGTVSGYMSFRYLNLTDADSNGIDDDTVNVPLEPLDVRSTWVYYNLVTNSVVASPSGNNWHIAFNRYTVKLNGGDGGTGGLVAGFMAHESPTLYPSGTINKTAVIAATPASTLSDLTGTLNTPADTGEWVADSFSSALNQEGTGDFPQISYGWYTYCGAQTWPPGPFGEPVAGCSGVVGADHQLVADPGNGALLRSSAGDSYARFRLTDISYANPSSASSQQTWTFEFEIQPAP